MKKLPPDATQRRFPRTAPFRAVVLSGVLALAALICVQRFRLESDLLAFLPMSENVPQLEVTRSLMRGPLKRALILNVVPESAESGQVARKVASQLSQALEGDSAIEKISTGPSPQFERAVFELYFPRRFLLAPPAPPGKEFWSKENLDVRLNETRTFLSSPAASVYRSLLPQDPLLLFRERLTALSALGPSGVALEDGQFVSSDGSAFIFARTKEALSFEHKTRLLALIDQTFAKLRGSAPLQLELSGTLPFEVEGERETRTDLTRVSAVSLVAIIGLSLLLFRGVLPLLLIFLPIVTGMLLACATTLLIFGEVHGLTLAFGSALLGVGMDYPLHLFNDQALHQDGPQRAISRVRRGLYVGCATTVAGFVAFSATSSPALLQVATFTGVGLVTSLMVTVWVLPFLPTSVGTGRIQRQLVKIGNWARRLGEQHRTWLIGSVLCLALVFSGTLLHSEWDTSTEALNPASKGLREADTRVRGRLGLSEELLVVRGETPTATLMANHELSMKLTQLRRDGRLESFSSLSSLYLPQSIQEENQRKLASPATQDKLKAALERAEFSRDAFAPAFADMGTPLPVLTLSELARGPLADLVEPFWMNLPKHTVALTRVKAPGELLNQIAAADAGTFRYNPSEFLSEAIAILTRSLRSVLLLGGGLMLLIVVLRHRKIRPICVAFAPAAFASLGALAIHGAFFGPLHLFHVLAALVVLSMGIDYGAFLVEAEDEGDLPWPSIFGAALSTMASFGTLALSSVPALHALGGIIFVGISLALIMTLIFSTFLKRHGPGIAPPPHATIKKFTAGALLLGALSGCHPNSPAAESSASAQADKTPGLSEQQLRDALLRPSEIPKIFWQQRLTIRFADQKHSISAVIQNDGELFQVLAVGPANTRLFLISQQGKDVSLKMFVDRQVNLDPGLLLLDIQRALFWFSEDPPPHQTVTSKLVRGFCSTDTWNAMGIAERKIADLPQSCEAALGHGRHDLVIRYEPAYLPGNAPGKITLTHARRDYTILVEHLASQDVAQ